MKAGYSRGRLFCACGKSMTKVATIAASGCYLSIMQIVTQILRIVLLPFLLLSMQAVTAQDNWKLKTDKDGVQVYMQPKEGSPFKVVKTVTVLNTTLTKVAAVLLDVMKTPEWVYGTKTCSILKQESPQVVYYYAEISMPWPASNRDFAIRISMSQNPQTKVITVLAENQPTYIPEKKGLVRIQHSAGKWTISPAGAGKVRVEYVLQVDPGGSLPAGIVNMFSYEGPFESFRNLQRQVDKPAYANAKIPFIVD